MSSKSVGVDRKRARAGVVATVLVGCASLTMQAQTCTTQAKMSPEVRNTLANAVNNLAQEIKSNNAAKVQSDTIAEFASAASFAPTAALVASTSAKVAQDSLELTQLYILDARGTTAGSGSEADFSCPLAGTTSETDFSISGLPPGLYAFAMVEATGDKPWLLSFLMRQDQEVWKLAGFYPKDRLVAGHDGLWYWTTARSYVKAKEPWIGWVYYGVAEDLLQPATFVTSTDMDALRSERTAGAPPELINGMGTDAPLVVKSGTSEFHFTSIAAGNSADEKQLRLTLHMNEPYLSDVTAAKARNIAAASALFEQHKDLHQGFGNVWVFADSGDNAPALTIQPMASFP